MADEVKSCRQKIQARLDVNEKEYASILSDAMSFFVTDHGYKPQELIHAAARYVESRMWLERFLSSSEF